MIFFVAGDGTITKTFPEKINQGSVLANSIYLIAPFAEGMVASVAFKLPNGVWTDRYPMDPKDKIDNLENIVDKHTGKPYAGWSLLLDKPITKLYGTVTAQFFFYSESDGIILASNATSFYVYCGVPDILPEEPTPDVYDLLLENISSLQKRLNNGIFAARALHRWSPTFIYGLGEITFEPNAGQFGAFVQSLVEDNDYPPYNENGELNTRYWQEVISFDHIADDYFNELKDLYGSAKKAADRAEDAAYRTERVANNFFDYKDRMNIWVKELPEIGDPEKIYAIPSSTEGILYDLYIWENEDWVFLGGVKLAPPELDNYVTTDPKNQIIEGRKIFRSAYNDVCLSDASGITIQPRIFEPVPDDEEADGPKPQDEGDKTIYPFSAYSNYDTSFVKSEIERFTVGYAEWGMGEPALVWQTEDETYTQAMQKKSGTVALLEDIHEAREYIINNKLRYQHNIRLRIRVTGFFGNLPEGVNTAFCTFLLFNNVSSEYDNYSYNDLCDALEIAGYINARKYCPAHGILQVNGETSPYYVGGIFASDRTINIIFVKLSNLEDNIAVGAENASIQDHVRDSYQDTKEEAASEEN